MRKQKTMKFERKGLKMTLLELQQVLGERIEIANDMAMGDAERKQENEKSEIIARLAKQMINNADVVLRTDKLIASGSLNKNSTISKIVGSDKDNE